MNEMLQYQEFIRLTLSVVDWVLLFLGHFWLQ